MSVATVPAGYLAAVPKLPYVFNPSKVQNAKFKPVAAQHAALKLRSGTEQTIFRNIIGIHASIRNVHDNGSTWVSNQRFFHPGLCKKFSIFVLEIVEIAGNLGLFDDPDGSLLAELRKGEVQSDASVALSYFVTFNAKQPRAGDKFRAYCAGPTTISIGDYMPPSNWVPPKGSAVERYLENLKNANDNKDKADEQAKAAEEARQKAAKEKEEAEKREKERKEAEERAKAQNTTGGGRAGGGLGPRYSVGNIVVQGPTGPRKRTLIDLDGDDDDDDQIQITKRTKTTETAETGGRSIGAVNPLVSSGIDINLAEKLAKLPLYLFREDISADTPVGSAAELMFDKVFSREGLPAPVTLNSSRFDFFALLGTAYEHFKESRAVPRGFLAARYIIEDEDLITGETVWKASEFPPGANSSNNSTAVASMVVVDDATLVAFIKAHRWDGDSCQMYLLAQFSPDGRPDTPIAEHFIGAKWLDKSEILQRLQGRQEVRQPTPPGSSTASLSGGDSSVSKHSLPMLCLRVPETEKELWRAQEILFETRNEIEEVFDDYKLKLSNLARKNGWTFISEDHPDFSPAVPAGEAADWPEKNPERVRHRLKEAYYYYRAGFWSEEFEKHKCQPFLVNEPPFLDNFEHLSKVCRIAEEDRQKHEEFYAFLKDSFADTISKTVQSLAPSSDGSNTTCQPAVAFEEIARFKADFEKYKFEAARLQADFDDMKKKFEREQLHSQDHAERVNELEGTVQDLRDQIEKKNKQLVQQSTQIRGLKLQIQVATKQN